MLFLKLSHTDIRELMPNEAYYKWYSNPKYKATQHIDSDQFDD
jgi:hypothetical protein